jgi:PAS domain S-box-containing protein
MLANISFLLGVGINLLADLSLLPMNFITSHGMQIGSGLDVALLSIALADRINILRQDKEKAEQETKLLNIQLEQKVIERTQELKESEEKFKAMFDYSNDGINFVDLETKEIILFNNRFQEMLGYSDSEISGMSIENIHPKQDWIWILEKFENAVQERILVIEDIPVLKKDGTVFFTDINSYSCESVKKPFLVGMFRDITERKQFADKLNQSVQYSLSIINSSMDMIIATDKAGSIFEFNISAQQLFQYRKDEIIGRNLSYLFLPLENSINIYDETIKRSSFYAETMCVCKDGREFVAAVSFSVMYAFDGEILGLVGVMRDITERKKMEMKQTQLFDELKAANEQLKNSQEQLVKSEKMAALGQLVTGVAHEINTPIGIALTSSSRLVTLSNNIQSSIENKTMKKSDFEQYLRDCVQGNDLIVRNLNRTADLIRSFKMVSADQTSQEIRKFNLRSYLKDIITSLGAKLKNTQHVIEIVSSEDIVLESNPGAIAQIITNLMMNSIIHGYEQGEKGHIVISCKAKNEVIILTYSDNGKGIPEENLKKIFDPFFTTKRGAGSTGLGLNIVFNLVDQSLKGTIRCESRVGQGRAGQGRAGQGRAGQGRAGKGRSGQGRAGQGTI